MLYIENISKNTVLGITHGGKIIEEKLEAGKVGQQWIQGKTNNEGYFNLKSYECQNLMTAMSSSDLKIKGNYTRSRYLLRYFDCLVHTNLSAAFATDQK